jgi:membrane protein YdbS with pleckstrin-like domain
MEARMESIKILPDRNLKKVWYAGWLLLFIPLTIGDYLLIALIQDAESRLIFGIMMTVSLLIWILVLFYIPLYFNKLEYNIEGDAVTGKKGVFWRKISTIPYYKITNIDITQGPLQRLFGISNIHCQTAGASGSQGARAELVLMGIRDSEQLKDTIQSRITRKDEC